jgi:hypothetical protein
MSDEAGAIPGGEVVSYPVSGDAPMTVEEAARDLQEARNKASSPAESAKEATAEPELSDEDNAAPPKRTPAKMPRKPTRLSLSRIEPPRSWTKAEKERSQFLAPRNAGIPAQREQERERDFRRSQNEIAEEAQG